MTETLETEPGPTEPDIIARPAGQLHDLPVQYRWEVTRRHPYYLVFWESALRYRRGEASQDEDETTLHLVAHLMLDAIGVTGKPVNPNTSFEQLDDGELDPAFLSGAVQPMTLRHTATTLINALPQSELAVLGAIFTTAGNSEYSVEGDDGRGSVQKSRALKHLDRIPSAALDSYPDAPLFYFHLGASQCTIVHDAKTQVRRWKRSRGISERRVHSSKLPKYLEAWDLREGWTRDGYDMRREHSFRDIADTTGEKPSTTASRYRKAFQMITGHEFSPQLWCQLVAPLKLNILFQDEAAILSAPMRHHLTPRTHRPVPESVVSPPTDESASGRFIESKVLKLDDQEVNELLSDVRELLEQGLSNERISERLECNIEIVQYMRDRVKEFNGEQ